MHEICKKPAPGVTYLIQWSGHGRHIIQKIDEDQNPSGHLKVEDEDGEEEVSQDQQAGGDTVDDVSLQATEDLVTVLDGSDDCAYALLHDM